MKIIGLTGGIASGKNFVAEILAKKDAAIFDADKEVHKLLESDKSTILEVSKKFSQSFIDKKINRKILGEIVFSDAKKLKILEKIIHPKIRKNHLEFLKAAKKSAKKIAVLNIPLLLEKEGYECDIIVAVIASKALQKKRFLARCKKQNPKNFTKEKKNLAEKFEQIYSKQANNSERKKAADFVINNNLSKVDTARQVKEILNVVNALIIPHQSHS